MDLVAADIGGTHARFTIATVSGGRIALTPEVVLKTADHPGFADAWRAFESQAGRALPGIAGIAVAGPVDADRAWMTNQNWILERSALLRELGLDRLTLVNDFAAVAHAVPRCDDLRHVCGPDRPLPPGGVVSVVGPGTGLGVAILVGDRVIATEGGHVEFAPLDRDEQRLRDLLAERHGRVSVERVLSGAGLGAIFEAYTGREPPEPAELWRLALSGTAPVARTSLDRFCRILGSVAGDLALAHGAEGVVIAGGLGLRLADHLPRSAFAERFVAKGRFQPRMEQLPVKLITHPQPGLLGAAAAFLAEQGA